MRAVLANPGLRLLAAYARRRFGPDGLALVFGSPSTDATGRTGVSWTAPDGRAIKLTPRSRAAVRVVALSARMRAWAPPAVGPLGPRGGRWEVPTDVRVVARGRLGRPAAVVARAIALVATVAGVVFAISRVGLPDLRAVMGLAVGAVVVTVVLLVLIAALPFVASMLTAAARPEPPADGKKGKAGERGKSQANRSTVPVEAPLVGCANSIQRATFDALARAVPHLGDALVRLAALVGFGILAAFAWVLSGVNGLRLVTGRQVPPVGKGVEQRLLVTGAGLRERVAARLGGGQMPGVFRDPLTWRRSPGGRPELPTWSPRQPEARLLADFANAVLLALDTHILGASTPERLANADYKLAVRRAWVDPSYLALVVQVSPPLVAARAASASSASLLPVLDAHFHLARGHLEAAANFSDPRLTADPRRDGLTGLFITLALPRTGQPVTDAGTDPDASISDPVVRAIRAGLREYKPEPLPADWFRLAPADEKRPNPQTIYDASRDEERKRWRFTSGHHTPGADAFRNDERVFLNLDRAIAFGAKVSPARMKLYTDYNERHFICDILQDPPPFPTGQAVELRRFHAAHQAIYRQHPYAVAVGLDRRGEPLWWDLAGGRQPPHGLIAGASGSGKSISGIVSIGAQLCLSNSPDQVALYVLDHRGQELANYLADLPHCRDYTVATAETTLAFVTRLLELVRTRQDTYKGSWDPSKGPLALVCFEEWQALMATLGNKDRDAVMDALDELCAAARKAGVRVLISPQKATSDVLDTRVVANTRTILMGLSRPADYQAILGTQDVPIPPGIPGRLAVAGLADKLRIVQGLYTSEGAARAIARELAARWPKPRDEQDAAPSARDDVDEHEPDVETPPASARDADPDETSASGSDDASDRPNRALITQDAVANLDPLTAARIIWDWRADLDDPPYISTEKLKARILALELTPPWERKIDAAIAALKRPEIGLLVPAPDRRFLVPSMAGWSVAYTRLRRAGIAV